MHIKEIWVAWNKALPWISTAILLVGTAVFTLTTCWLISGIYITVRSNSIILQQDALLLRQNAAVLKNQEIILATIAELSQTTVKQQDLTVNTLDQQRLALANHTKILATLNELHQSALTLSKQQITILDSHTKIISRIDARADIGEKIGKLVLESLGKPFPKLKPE